MVKSKHPYRPHLAIERMSLQPQVEWVPQAAGWSLCQIETGTGYWLHPQLNQELETGSVFLLAAEAQGSIRASQLGGELSLNYFNVVPSRLTGLMTMAEQLRLEKMAPEQAPPLKLFPPHSDVAARMKGLCANQNERGHLHRLQLLLLFFEVFGNDLKPEMAPPETTPEAKTRLREFLQQVPESDLLHMNFSELAERMRCTPRHLTRIFQEVVGVSFRDKHTKLRLARARELLAATEHKVVDVALESGFQSLSLFNLMFKRRFGVSPGRWRKLRQSGQVTQVQFASRKKSIARSSNRPTVAASQRVGLR